MSDDRAPRWVVRWLVTAVLLLVIAVECVGIYQEVDYIAGIDARFQRISCELPRTIAAGATTPRLQLAMAKASLIVCSPANR